MSEEVNVKGVIGNIEVKTEDGVVAFRIEGAGKAVNNWNDLGPYVSERIKAAVAGLAGAGEDRLGALRQQLADANKKIAELEQELDDDDEEDGKAGPAAGPKALRKS